MVNENSEIDRVVEVSVPPISMADKERDLSNGQDIDLVEFAEFAISESGTPGGLGVALDSLQALSEDLEKFAHTGAAPGDLELHAEAIEEVANILHSIADSEIESYETPLYTDSNSDSAEKEAGESEVDNPVEDKNSIPSKNLTKVVVDRISGSDNIIAEPIESSKDHIHVQNGTVGETAIAYHPDGKFTSKGTNKPYTFNSASEKDVRANHQRGASIPLTEGQQIQIPKTTQDEAGFIYIEGFELEAIKIEKEIEDGSTVLLKIDEVKTNTAVATLKSVSRPRSSPSKNGTIFKSNTKRTVKSESSGIPKVSQGLAGKKNELLSGKKM